MSIRAVIAVAAILLGAALAIKFLFATAYFSAAAVFLCGMLVGTAVMLGFVDSFFSPWWGPARPSVPVYR